MTDLPRLRLKTSEERRLREGHVWIFSNEVDIAATPLKAINPGDQVVVEDSKDFMFKIKLPYYSFWKQMRALKDRIIKNRAQKITLPHAPKSPEEGDFYGWALTQPDEILAKDIISVRHLYRQSFADRR